MKCPNCNYNRLVGEYCANCGAYLGMRGSFEEYIVDYLGNNKINGTSIYIFPTILGKDKSFGHWTEEIDVKRFLDMRVTQIR